MASHRTASTGSEKASTSGSDMNFSPRSAVRALMAGVGLCLHGATPAFASIVPFHDASSPAASMLRGGLEPAVNVVVPGREDLSRIDNRVYRADGNPYDPDWKNTIAICAIMRQENPADVKEWLDYHRFVGVDMVFLRENDSVSSIEKELQSYKDEGFVDHALLEGPKHPTQTNWFNDCGVMARKRGYSWVTYLDLDEFMVVLDGETSVPTKGALKQLLCDRFRYNAAVSMQWILFGSAKQQQHPAEGQLAGFNRCTGQLSKQMKCMGNSYWLQDKIVFRPTHVHQCTLKPGAAVAYGDGTPVDMFQVKLPNGSSKAVSYRAHVHEDLEVQKSHLTAEHSLVLFHYVTRSRNDFMQRKINLRSGVYASEFAALAKAAGPFSEQATFDAFEARHGFDGDHAICHQGAALAAAVKAAASDAAVTGPR